jgi:transposase-like protein
MQNKLNLLIRTYTLENLYTSLFDIPNKISYEFVELYIHNDNPERNLDFDIIIDEFQTKYPNYIIHKIYEKENQHMFMSFLNSIPYLNTNNTWTMLLDDDD